MGAINHSFPWTSPPQINTGIKWSNPFTLGLIGAFLPGIPINIVDGVGLTGFSSIAPTIGNRTQGRTIVTGAIGYPPPINSTAKEAKFDLNIVTALVVAVQDSPENANEILYRGNGSSSAGWAVGLHGGSFNGVYAVMGSWSTAGTGAVSTTAPRVAVVRGDGSTASAFIDGVLVDSGSYTAPSYQYDTVNERRMIFGSLSGLGKQNQSRPSLGLVWNRPLSDSDIRTISANPWQLFA